VGTPKALIADGLRRRSSTELRAIQNNAAISARSSKRANARAPGIANLKVRITTACTAFYIEGHAARSRRRCPTDYRRRQTLKNAERYITARIENVRRQGAFRAGTPRSHRESCSTIPAPISLRPPLPRCSAVAGAPCRARSADHVCRARANARFLHAGNQRRISDRNRSRTPSRWSKRRSGGFIANDRAARARAPDAARDRPQHGRQIDLHAAGRADHAARRTADRSCRRGRAARRSGGPDFSRAWAASDDLAGGAPTFMVEMTEAAYILHHASPASPGAGATEIGPRTSTFGRARAAWAIARHLLEVNKSLTLFATHYFELTRLAQDFRQLAQRASPARSNTRTTSYSCTPVEEGPASPELRPARLPSLPAAAGVIRAARKHLVQLERKARAAAAQPDLFAGAVKPAPAPAIEAGAARRAAGASIPTFLTPRQALDALYQPQTSARRMESAPRETGDRVGIRP